MKTSIDDFKLSDEVTHVELAAVSYDQWILTVAVRKYGSEETVIGMSHVAFEEVEGFRVLNESAMLMFPWTKLDSGRSFVHRVPDGGWYSSEVSAGNMHLPESVSEYVIVTNDECVSVIAYKNPKHLHS